MDPSQRITVQDVSKSLQKFTWIDYGIFIVMLIICGLIGLYFGFMEKRRKRTDPGSEAAESEFLVGGRKMKVFPVSMSLIGSWFSGIALLGSATEVYQFGTEYPFIVLSAITSAVLAAVFFIPVLFNLRLTSIFEYLEMRFDKRIRLFGSICFTFSTLVWLPIVIYVPALTFNQVTGVNIHIVTPVVCIICIFYTSVGGLKAVVWTDVVQNSFMYSAILMICIKGTWDIGGFSEVIQRNLDSGRFTVPVTTIDPTVRHSTMSLFVGGLVWWIQTNTFNQHQVQRYLSLPTLRDTRKAIILFITGVTLLLTLCFYCGLLIYATYQNCDPLQTGLAKAKDQLLPLLVMDIFSDYPGVPGLFVAGVFSAALSSLSSALNSMAAVVLEDFYKAFFPHKLTERQTNYLMRSVVLIFGIACVCLVHVIERLGSVLQLSMSLGAISMGPLTGVFFIGLLIPWIGSRETLIGGSCSLFIMGWISIRAQADIAVGRLTFQTKPLTVEGCAYDFVPRNSSIPIISEDAEFQIHHLSYLLYGFTGSMLTILIATGSCIFLGFSDPNNVDGTLVVRFMRRFARQSDNYKTTCVIHNFSNKDMQLVE